MLTTANTSSIWDLLKAVRVIITGEPRYSSRSRHMRLGYAHVSTLSPKPEIVVSSEFSSIP